VRGTVTEGVRQKRPWVFYWKCTKCGWEGLDQPKLDRCPNCGKKKVVKVRL